MNINRRHKSSVLSLAFFSVVLLSLIGCDSSKKYQIYHCDKELAKSCTDGCEISKGAKIQFKVSKESSSVMEIFFIDGEQKAASTTENCKIFDDKNWDCSSKDSTLPWVVIQRAELMANGIYTNYTEYIDKKTYKDRLSDQKATCAK
jgi:hypothetical protein